MRTRRAGAHETGGDGTRRRFFCFDAATTTNELVRFFRWGYGSACAHFVRQTILRITVDRHEKISAPVYYSKMFWATAERAGGEC